MHRKELNDHSSGTQTQGRAESARVAERTSCRRPTMIWAMRSATSACAADRDEESQDAALGLAA